MSRPSSGARPPPADAHEQPFKHSGTLIVAFEPQDGEPPSVRTMRSDAGAIQSDHSLLVS